MAEIDLNSVQFDEPHPDGGKMIDLGSANFDQQDNGIFSRIGQDIGQRAQTGQDIQKAYGAGEINLPHAVLQHVGNVGFGTMADVTNEAAKSVISGAGDIAQTLAPNLSSAVKDYASTKLHDILSSDIGKTAIEAAQYGGQKLDELQKNYPNVYRDLTGLGNALYFINPLSKDVAETAATGAEGAADIGKKAAGAVGDVAGTVASYALPSADEGLKDVASLAVKHNIPLSVDQITSSPALKNIQKISQELPFSGQTAFREAQMEKFNQALLGTVGQTGTKITPLKMRQAFSTVGKEFDKFGEGKVFTLDDAFARGLDQIKQEASMTSSSDAIKNFENAATMVLKEGGPTGEITGEKLNTLRSTVNALARKSNSQDTADLLHQLELSLIDKMTGGNEKEQAALSLTKQKYKNLLAIEPLAVKAKGGNINPTMLNNRVYSIYGRQHVIGNSGDIGDLARIGNELLPQLGGSDTLQKALYAKGAGLAGTVAAEPVLGLPTVAATLTGNRIMQSGINRNQSIIKAMLKKGK